MCYHPLATLIQTNSLLTMKKPSEVFDTPQATGFDRVTHNSRDWEADFDTLFEWTDFDGQIGSFVLVKTKSDYAIEETERNELKAFIHQELQKAREESGKRNAVVKEYQDEGVMFILKIEDGKTYEASMPIPKWAEVGKLQLRDQSELDQPTV